VSRYNRCEARSRVSRSGRGALAWGYQPSTGPAPRSSDRTSENTETEDLVPIVIAGRSGDSPDA
jgi:hypothetical protein